MIAISTIKLEDNKNFSSIFITERTKLKKTTDLLIRIETSLCVSSTALRFYLIIFSFQLSSQILNIQLNS